MARITTSALISDIRGKVGGVVFQGGQSGLIVRNKSIPVNRRTLAQTQSKKDLFNIQQEWRALTDSQRDDWNLFAATYPVLQKFSTTKTINGQQYFIKYNDYRVRYNLGILQDPDFTLPSFNAVDVNIFNFNNNMFCLINRRIDPNEEFVVLFLSFETTNSVTNAGNRRKMIVFPTNFFNNYIITNQYNAIFGRLPDVGTELFYKVAIFSKRTAYWTSFTEGKLTVLQNFGVGYMAVGSTNVVF